MSFYSDASLVVEPAIYKAGTLFSAKPGDGSGDLTFTRSNDTATRVGPDGLIEKVRTNLFTYSEQLDNAAWTKVDTTIVANAVANPLNGAVTADKITDSTTSTAAHYFFQSPASSGTIYTSSGYFKKAEYNFVVVHAFGLGGAVFNLDTGVKVSQSGGVGTITSVGDGWYRCTFTFTATGGGVFFSQSLAGSVTYAGTIGSGIFGFGCQLETGDIATDYIATTTAAVSVGPVANVPRLDYLNSSCPRLLLEPQRTNLALFSESFDNAGWTKTETTISANAATSPDGYTNADKLIASTNNAAHETRQSFSGLSGSYTISCFLKASEYNFAFVRSQVNLGADRYGVIIDLTNGTTYANTTGSPTGVSHSVTSYGNGWYRLSVTATTSSFLAITIGPANGTTFGGNSLPATFAGNGTNGILAYGAMAEAGSYATSYIPTLGAAVTRGADLIPDQTTTIAQAFTDDSQGTILFDISNVDSNATGSEARWRFGSSATPLQIAFILESAGLRVFSYNGNFTLTPSNKLDRKIAIRFNGTQIVAFVNGVKQTTYNAATAFDIDQLTSVQTSPATFGLNQFILFPTALSDADCIALTA